jgi:hypothetical protein
LETRDSRLTLQVQHEGKAMPELVRLYIRSVFFGFAIAGVFTLGLVWLDVAGIGRLILGSDIGWIAAVMLVIFNGIVFSAVQFAFKVMGMAETDEGPKGGRGSAVPALVPVTVPVAVPVRGKRRV